MPKGPSISSLLWQNTWHHLTLIAGDLGCGALAHRLGGFSAEHLAVFDAVCFWVLICTLSSLCLTSLARILVCSYKEIRQDLASITERADGGHHD
jgi:hypothetical protein